MATLSQVAGMAMEDLEEISISIDAYKGLNYLAKLSDYELDNPRVLSSVIQILYEVMLNYKDQNTEHHDELKREILGRIRSYEAKLTRMQSRPRSIYSFGERY